MAEPMPRMIPEPCGFKITQEFPGKMSYFLVENHHITVQCNDKFVLETYYGHQLLYHPHGSGTKQQLKFLNDIIEYGRFSRSTVVSLKFEYETEE